MKRLIAIAVGVLTLTSTPVMAKEALDQGLWWLYHLQYEKARESFETHVHAHPDDPAGYFYLTATSWWHLAQNVEYPLPEVEAQLAEDSQATISTAKKLFDSTKDPKEKARACLYGGGAEGLWGRHLVTKRDWAKAYFAGKRGAKMLRKAVALDPNQYDAYLGLGIYDYYTDTLTGVQAVLAAMLIHGDKKRGLHELHLALEKGEHSKVEAMCFLIEIYTSEEKVPEQALPLAETLRKKFPQSPAMHLIKVSTLYSMNAWDAVLLEAQDLLEKSNAETPWYSKSYIAPARYCIGVAQLLGKKDLAAAESEMKKILEESDQKSRWIGFAHYRLGQIHDVRGNRQDALAEYEKAMAGIDLWGLHKDVALYKEKPFRL